mmetsp:Transcript_10938/g.32371  ORF Transcript_10938/g.32371 Transcript_10938/m.32371 type:complete len:239 (-) Transcript_10938:342-1058(-)
MSQVRVGEAGMTPLLRSEAVRHVQIVDQIQGRYRFEVEHSRVGVVLCLEPSGLKDRRWTTRGAIPAIERHLAPVMDTVRTVFVPVLDPPRQHVHEPPPVPQRLLVEQDLVHEGQVEHPRSCRLVLDEEQLLDQVGDFCHLLHHHLVERHERQSLLQLPELPRLLHRPRKSALGFEAARAVVERLLFGRRAAELIRVHRGQLDDGREHAEGPLHHGGQIVYFLLLVVIVLVVIAGGLSV